MEHPNLKVCLVQAELKSLDIDGNLKKVDELLGDHAVDADLIVLPEMFTTGFSMKAESLAEPISGKTVQWMKGKSQTLGSAIVGSIIIEDAGKYYNRIVFAMPSGEIMTYDKRHLFRMGDEHNHYTAGSKRLIVHYKGWRICPLICYDLRFPVWSRNRNDYDLLIYVANWPSSRSFAWRSLLVARAIENQCYVIGVNRVGVEEGLNYSGDSSVIDPRGAYLKELIPNRESVASAELSLPKLLEFREKFPVMLDGDDFKINI